MKYGKRLWLIFAILISTLYILCCFTPLRLCIDSIRFFALAEDVTGTWPAEFGKPHDFLPFGYPYLLAGLQKLHLLNSFTLCLFHLGFLIGSIFFIKKLFHFTDRTAILVCFILLSWTTIRFTITPFSEMQFLFFTVATLYYYQLFTNTRKIAHL